MNKSTGPLVLWSRGIYLYAQVPRIRYQEFFVALVHVFKHTDTHRAFTIYKHAHQNNNMYPTRVQVVPVVHRGTRKINIV